MGRQTHSPGATPRSAPPCSLCRAGPPLFRKEEREPAACTCRPRRIHSRPSASLVTLIVQVLSTPAPPPAPCLGFRRPGSSPGLPLAVCGVLSRSGPRSEPQSPIFPGSGTTLKGTVPTKGLVLPSQQLGGVSVSILQMRRATERVKATHPSPREPVAPGHILGIP